MKYKFVVCGEEVHEAEIDCIACLITESIRVGIKHCNGQMGLVQAVPVENFPSTPESVPAGVAFGAN